MNAICRSVNLDEVVILLGGGGDTSTLHYVIKVVSTFCNLAWQGRKNLVAGSLESAYWLLTGGLLTFCLN